jgi:hypothetical protein
LFWGIAESSFVGVTRILLPVQAQAVSLPAELQR